MTLTPWPLSYSYQAATYDLNLVLLMTVLYYTVKEKEKTDTIEFWEGTESEPES